MLNDRKFYSYVQVAKVQSELSHCTRLNVGACLFNLNTGRVLATGYNGTPAGFINCDELFIHDQVLDRYSINPKLKYYLDTFMSNVDLGKEPIEVDFPTFLKYHHEFSEKYETHAEMNCLLNAYRDGLTSKSEEVGLAITHQPCYNCCKLIASSGIKVVLYENCYDRNDESKVNNHLKKFGIKVGKIVRDVYNGVSVEWQI